jgi:DNA-directed RNA polymerase subunit beta
MRPTCSKSQIQSFKDFFQLETTPDKRNIEGLFRVFRENFPITDTRNIFVLSSWIILLTRHAILLKNVWSATNLCCSLKAKLRLSCNDEDT